MVDKQWWARGLVNEVAFDSKHNFWNSCLLTSRLLIYVYILIWKCGSRRQMSWTRSAEPGCVDHLQRCHLSVGVSCFAPAVRSYATQKWMDAISNNEFQQIVESLHGCFYSLGFPSKSFSPESHPTSCAVDKHCSGQVVRCHIGFGSASIGGGWCNYWASV